MMAQPPRTVKITPVGYDDPFATETPKVKITPVGYDDPFKAPTPPRTPTLLESLDRGGTEVASAFDLIGYAGQQGIRKLFGSGNVDAVDRFVQKHTGVPLIGQEFTGDLIDDVHHLNSLPRNPVLDQAGEAFHKSPTTLGGVVAGLGVIARNPSVIPHIIAETLPSLPVGGVGGKIATKAAAPIIERIALTAGEKAAQAATVGTFGAGMNTAMTVAHAGDNVAAQEHANPSAPGTINSDNVTTGVEQTAGQVPGAALAGALLPLGSSRFTSPAVRVGARVLTQSAVQGAGNVVSVVGGNAAIGRETTPEEVFAAGAGGLVTGPADLAARAFHARGAAFDRLMGEFAKRTGGPDIATPQFGDTPHPTDGGFHETPEGVVADEAGNPVGFADHKAAARFAAGNDLGGSHELAIASDPDGGTKVILRRRAAAPVVSKPVDGDPFANEPDAPHHIAVEGDPFAKEPPAPEPQPATAVPAPTAGGDPPVAPTDAPEPPVLHANDLRPEPGDLADGEHYVTTPAGARIRSRYEVVPAASLLPAEGDLQNRDRSRDTTDLQVQDIVSGFDPSRLAASAETDRGSPIVGPDHVVESGNGRMLAINRIYGDPANAEKAAAYRHYLESQGHSTEGVENPVLIRRRMTDMSPEQRRQFVIDSNKDTKLALTSVERARSDADALDSHALEQFRGGDVASAGNAEFVKTFIGRMAKPEQAAMVDGDRNLSQDGITRIENALMARAYENPAVLSKLIEARDNNIRSIGAGMLDNAGGWAKLRAGVKDGTVKPEFDITDQLVEAARRVSDLRAKGDKIGDALRQGGMFEKIDPIVESFMRAFYNPELSRAASREAVTDLIGSYVRRASEQTTAPRLFGGDDTSPAEILGELLEERGNRTGDMFAQAAERAPRGSDDQHDTGPIRDRRHGPAEISDDEDGGTNGDDVVLNYGTGRAPAPAEKPAYAPTFEAASSTNRASIYDSAAVALGMSADDFRLLAAPRQVQLLRSLVAKTFGVHVTVDRGMQERFAIDQMLDMYQNVQGMAHVLGIPAKGISLGGALKLTLQKKGSFLGAYQPGKTTIILPKRSNSFAHEWGHAFDYFLQSAMTEAEGRGLTGAIRKDGGAILNEPASVGKAFVALLNAMFFDKAQVAHRIMTLEAKIAATDNQNARGQAQRAIDKLKDGNSQIRDLRSAFYSNAKAYEGGGPGGDYWQSPTEMFARAFEAYVSYRAELNGIGTEFIGKGDAAYLSNADERFAKTFPKGDEREAIFDAFNDVFEQVSKSELLGAGPAAARGSANAASDIEPGSREGNWLRRMVDDELGSFADRNEQRSQFKEGRVKDPRTLDQKASDLAGFFAFGMTAEMKMLGRRYKSRTIKKLHGMLEFTSGSGKHVQERGFIMAARMHEGRLMNRVHAAYSEWAPRSGVTKRQREMTKPEKLELRDLLISEDVPGASPQMRKLAATLRKIEDDTFYALQQVGIDVGYTRNGHLMRMLDMGIVSGDVEGFKAAAAEAYEVKFDRTFSDDAAKILSDDKMLGDVMKLAKLHAKIDPEVHAKVAPVVAALKKIAKLRATAKGSEDPAAIEAEVKKLTAELKGPFAEMVTAVRSAVAKSNAAAWHQRLTQVAPYDFDSKGPSANFAKHREMPPEADKILEKYYINDPRQVVETYVRQAAHRIEYARRFGHDNAKINQILEDMAAEGVPAVDIETVKSIFELATGRSPSNIKHPTINSAMSALRFVYGTAALLPRATFSSLSEALTAGIVMGDVKYGFHALAATLAQAIGTASAKERREIARITGSVRAAQGSQILAERFGGAVNATRWDKLAEKMYYNSGLTALTNAQITGMLAPAHAFLASLGRDIVDGLDKNATAGGRKRDMDEAVARYRELGIRDPEAFAREIVATGRMPSPLDLEGANADPASRPYEFDWMTATNRLQMQSIQQPSVMSRPRAASSAVGQFVYGIMSFNYEMYRNIIKGEMIRTWERAERGGAGYSARRFAFGLMPSLAAVLIGSIISTVVREILTNNARFKARLADGTLASAMVSLGIQRAIGTPLDPVIQAAGGTKFNRAPFLQLLGPTLGNIGQSVNDIAGVVAHNSRKTNTAEHNATRGTYRLLSPWAVAGLSALPGGPVLSALAGLGAGAITSPQAGEMAGDVVVGRKDGSPGPDGKKIKSGPTALDRSLDGVFGPVGKRSKATANPYLH